MEDSQLSDIIDEYLKNARRSSYQPSQGEKMMEIIPPKFLKPIHLSLLAKLDENSVTVESLEISANTSSFEGFVYSLLTREILHNMDVIDAVISFVNTYKEGSTSRHFFIMTFLSSLNYRDHSSKFYSVSVVLLQIIEYLFGEIYQTDSYSSPSHSPEEREMIYSKGLPILKKMVLTFIKNNHTVLKLEEPPIIISEFVSINDHFDKELREEIPLDRLNKASFVRFLGNLIAKVDFAKFFAQRLGSTGTVRVLSEFESLLKPFHGLVFSDSFAILQSESDFVNFKKYRGLLADQTPTTETLVNLHATILLSADRKLSPWVGYGSILCIFILRSFGSSSFMAPLSPLRYLKLVSSSFFGISDEYLGGIEYYSSVLRSLLVRLKSSVGFCLENGNELNCFLSDFVITLHSIDHQNSPQSESLIKELFLFSTSLLSLQQRYLLVIRCLDLTHSARSFCQARGFSSGLVRLCLEEVKAALDKGTKQGQLFLRETLVVRLLGIIEEADRKDTGSIAEGRLV